MKLMTLAGLFCLLPSSIVTGESTSGLDTIVKNLTSETISEVQKTKRLLQKDKQELRQQLRELKAALQEQESLLEESRSKYKDLVAKEHTKREALKEEKETIQAIQGAVMVASRQTQDMLKKSPIVSEYQNERKFLEDILEKEYFPGMSDIGTLSRILFLYIRDSGKILKYSGEFIGEDGKEVLGDIVRLGGIGAVYKKENTDEVGYLRNGPKGRFLVEVAGDPSWLVRQDLKGFIEGQHNHLPLDISGGAVFKRLVHQKSWREWIHSGGFLVWPIFFVGFLAFLIGCERSIFLLRIRSNSDRIMNRITQLAEDDQWEDCQQFCEKNQKYPTCQVLKSAFQHLGTTQQVLENALQESLLRQLPRLERFLPTLSVLAAIAPLLGLLGTVTGMINTFQVITIFGTGEPKLMAGGISEALITTQLGLAVAIPVMLLHHFLERRVDKILGDIEEKGSTFTLTLLKKEQIKGKEVEDAG
jgi:biopolymer transport protein ExbB